MKKFIILITILTLSFFITSCASAPSKDGEDINRLPTIVEPEYGTGDYYPDVESPSKDSESPDSNKGDIQAGQITSSAWSDNENFDYWLDLITNKGNEQDPNKHYLASTYQAVSSKAPGIEVKNMYKVTLTSNNVVLNNAKVNVRINDQNLFSGYTNAAGIIYVFINDLYDTNITFDIDYQGQKYSKTFETLPKSKEISLDIPDLKISNINVLDLALIIDTTGSMGDELTYLKVELQNVLDTIIENNLNLEIRLALLFYRDEGDQYVTRVFDFSTDLKTQCEKLSMQSAAGGGDTPEAVHTVLKKAESLSWSKESTKIAIHVCDAPPHNDNAILQSVVSSTKTFAELGIRMIPVICSGSNYLTEFIFRQMALYTGGTYTYVTDHSGIGGSHTDQATPKDTVVEYLNKMLIRLITEYITGEDIAPVAYNAKDKHTVSFDTQGGSKVNVQIVENDGYLTKIENPKKEGYVFIGWIIKGADSFELFSFDTKITSSIVLQALWLEDVPLHTDSPTTFTVRFNSNCDQIYNPQIVSSGDLVNKPADPVKEGYTFIGWYTYQEGVLIPFNFDEPITSNVELNAIFIEK